MSLVELKGKQVDVERAMEMIKTILAAPVSSHSRNWVPSDQIIAGEGLTPPTKIVQKTFTVPDRDAGAIIGEKGVNVKMVWREAGVHVRFHVMKDSSRRLVQIMGEETRVERALDLIKKKVLEENEKI